MDLELIYTFIVVGVLMIACEIFIPGGVVGGFGAVLMLIGVISGFKRDPQLGLWLLLGSLVFCGLALWAWAKFFPRSPMGKRLILQTDAKEWRGYENAHLALLGKQGSAHTVLRPAGTAIIDGRRVDVVTRGEMIAAKKPIQVVEIEGNRVVVEEILEEEHTNT